MLLSCERKDEAEAINSINKTDLKDLKMTDTEVDDKDTEMILAFSDKIKQIDIVMYEVDFMVSPLAHLPHETYTAKGDAILSVLRSLFDNCGKLDFPFHRFSEAGLLKITYDDGDSEHVIIYKSPVHNDTRFVLRGNMYQGDYKNGPETGTLAVFGNIRRVCVPVVNIKGKK